MVPIFLSQGTTMLTATTMPSLRKLHNAPGLVMVDETPIPEVPEGHVLIQVRRAGICGTDRHIYEWDAWSQSRVKLGIATGHELAGVIVETGPGVRHAKVGQRVSAEGHIACGVCQACRTGNAHICPTVEIIGIDRDGGFAHFVSVPEENLWPIHPEISYDIAATFDPLGNAVHTVMSAGVSGQTVLITGVGTIGLMAVSVALAAGAARIIAIDVDPRRLEIAKKLGANLTLDARTDWKPIVRDYCGGAGPDVLLEMSGYAKTINDGLEAIRNGGRAALLGLPGGKVELDLSKHVIFKGITIIGVNGRRMFETWYQMESLVLSGRMNFSDIITHRLPFEEWERGFKLMQSGEAIKVILRISED